MTPAVRAIIDAFIDHVDRGPPPTATMGYQDLVAYFRPLERQIRDLLDEFEAERITDLRHEHTN
jgi:hypothetical protein